LLSGSFTLLDVGMASQLKTGLLAAELALELDEALVVWRA